MVTLYKYCPISQRNSHKIQAIRISIKCAAVDLNSDSLLAAQDSKPIKPLTGTKSPLAAGRRSYPIKPILRSRTIGRSEPCDSSTPSIIAGILIRPLRIICDMLSLGVKRTLSHHFHRKRNGRETSILTYYKPLT